jgi:hypothetical protein
MRIMTGVGDLVQRIEDGQIHVRYSVARQSKGRVMPCAFCTIHKETRFPGLGLKTKSYDLMVWASKSPRQFFDFSLKTKLAMVCRLRHKTDGKRTMRGTCRDLVTLLSREASRTRVSQFASKLADERWRVVHMTSSRR